MDKRMICWKDNQEIVSALDVIAEKQGIDRSDVIRMMVREKLGVATDSETKK